MNYKPYPNYKDSGIEWLGNVPEAWEVRSIRRIFQIVNGSTPKSSEPDYWEGNIAWATPDEMGKLNGDTLTETQRTLSREGYESCGTTLVPIGSLILSTRAPIGHLAIAGIPLCTNQGCRSLVFSVKGDTRYYFYMTLSAREELTSRGEGTTFKELSKDKLAEVKCVFPPLPEQRAIAAFLDRETGRIDELIAKKERQIELLQEKRQALISHAVTKGLNPQANLKDSGIEWLGMIPEGWEVKPIRRIFRIVNGSTPKSSEPDYWEGDIAWATPDEMGKLNGDTLTETQRTLTREGYDSCGTTLVPIGSLILSTRAPIGHLAIAGIPLCTNQGCRSLVFDTKGDTQYYFYLTLSAREELASRGEGTTFKELSKDKLAEVKFTSPPLSEQRAIAAFLDRETGRIDNMANKIRESIEKLREYRTALISAAVTGKIDVRGVV
ncbi:MAG: restriction endonuclease subunit S [Calditrichaeota bacterium]|nr:restriction endonuclease subunit S [Calditrichota bacterium]